MDATRRPPEDLVLIKKAVEGQIFPELDKGSFLDAQLAVSNVLGSVDHGVIAQEHAGPSVLATLKLLEKVLERNQLGMIAGVRLRIEAALAQSLMYY